MVVAISVTAIGVLPAFLTAALAVQIRNDLALSLPTIGALFGFFFAVSALGSAPLGRLVERRGSAEGIRLAALGSGLTLIGMATIARDVWTIGALFVVGGLATATAQPAANLALARSVPQNRLGLLFGLKHVAAPAAGMMAGLAVPGFGVTVGWRWAFVVGAAIALATVLAAPKMAGAAQDQRRQVGEAVPSSPLRILVLLAVAIGLGIGAAGALAAFIVSYAVDSGLDEGAAGILLAAGSVLALVTRLVSGWLVDKRQHAGLLGVGALLSFAALGVAILAAGGRQWLVVGAMLGFAAGWGWSGLMTFVVVWANPRAPAATTGITHTGTYVGSAIVPPLVGLLAERTSFALAWWATSAALVLAACLVFGVWFFGRGEGGIARPSDRNPRLGEPEDGGE